jgi:hypothetical protein
VRADQIERRFIAVDDFDFDLNDAAPFATLDDLEVMPSWKTVPLVSVTTFLQVVHCHRWRPLRVNPNFRRFPALTRP